jgi:hypothetical protein
MPRWANWALKIMIAGLVTSLLLGVVAPHALGFGSPTRLWSATRPKVTLQVHNLAPGDAVSQTIEIGNDGPEAMSYCIVFVKWGKIWSCDAGDHKLDYTLSWNAGANQRLRPGEVETVDVNVGLPLSAQRGCMGQKGFLYIRRGPVENKKDAAVYECIALPFFRPNLDDVPDPTHTRGIICYKSGGPVDRILNPHRWREP